MQAGTDLSLFYKILILVEDRGRITLDDLDTLGNKRPALGALGRLEGLNYIEREGKDDTPAIFLTDKGDALLAHTIGYVARANNEWDNTWRMILFDIPESERTVRQMFRLKLMDLGARMLQSSVWISPHQSVVDDFTNTLEHARQTSRVYFFQAKNQGDNAIDIAKLWDLPNLEQEYRQLFSQFSDQYKNLKRQSDASFAAKCMIVQLALLAKKDPWLPDGYMPSNWIGFQARDWYQKIRTFCR